MIGGMNRDLEGLNATSCGMVFIGCHSFLGYHQSSRHLDTALRSWNDALLSVV
jgi:hypothetical protein